MWLIITPHILPVLYVLQQQAVPYVEYCGKIFDRASLPVSQYVHRGYTDSVLLILTIIQEIVVVVEPATAAAYPKVLGI